MVEQIGYGINCKLNTRRNVFKVGVLGTHWSFDEELGIVRQGRGKVSVNGNKVRFENAQGAEEAIFMGNKFISMEKSEYINKDIHPLIARELFMTQGRLIEAGTINECLGVELNSISGKYHVFNSYIVTDMTLIVPVQDGVLVYGVNVLEKYRSHRDNMNNAVMFDTFREFKQIDGNIIASLTYLANYHAEAEDIMMLFRDMCSRLNLLDFIVCPMGVSV